MQGPALSLRPADRVGSHAFRRIRFTQNFDFCAGAFAKRPVDGDAFADLGDEFGRDDFEIIFAHDVDGAVVGGECIVKSYFVVVQSQIDAPLVGFFQVLRQLD